MPKPFTMIDDIRIKTYRWDCGTLRGMDIEIGDCDENGHVRTVGVYQHNWGQGFIIQTNFIDFYEQRLRVEDALGVAMKIATNCCEEGAHVDAELAD